jgi:large subunit ribosomal protein L17
MLINLVRSLIKHKRIRTTLARAKAVRPFAEKLLTIGRRGQRAVALAASATDEQVKARAVAENVHCRRLVAARLRSQPRTLFHGSAKRPGKVKRLRWRENEDVVHILFDKIAPVFKDRPGGYTRIVKLGQRIGDASHMAILEWVESIVPEAPSTAPVNEKEEPKAAAAAAK